MRKIVICLLVVGVVAGVIGFSFMQGAKIGGTKAVMQLRAQAVTPYVRAGKPIPRTITDNTRFIAIVKPLNAVDVKTQVAGTIEEVLFTDGQFVEEGETLFTIEQDRYKANVSAAKASLSKAEADLKQMTSDYGRQKELYNEKVVSTADLEKAESRMAQAQAAVEQAKANLELAEFDMEHTVIKAPIEGRIGQVLITKGNYVDLSSKPLARIVQTTPVKIAFSMTDKEHLRLRKVLRNGAPSERPNLQVELSDGTLLPLATDRIFFDNEMDKTTATMSLYAEYDNLDELLVPNDHVTLLWTNNAPKGVLVVPQTAVQRDATGPYVMVLNQDKKVSQKYVETGDILEDGFVIENGLTVQDEIVLVGAQKLQNGQTVEVISTEVK